jgi:hypothetical protein
MAEQSARSTNSFLDTWSKLVEAVRSGDMKHVSNFCHVYPNISSCQSYGNRCPFGILRHFEIMAESQIRLVVLLFHDYLGPVQHCGIPIPLEAWGCAVRRRHRSRDQDARTEEKTEAEAKRQSRRWK